MEQEKNIAYWKEWRDEGMKTICGFANADGGKIIIGMDENGNTDNLQDCFRLQEVILRKTIQELNVIIDIKVNKRDGAAFIVIKVPKSNFPVSYFGKYYFHDAGEDMHLSGIPLQALVLQKSGKRWEDLPVEGSSLNDIDDDTLNKFIIKAVESGRLSDAAVKMGKESLLKNIGLLSIEGCPTNAALLLFGKNLNKISVTAAFKIARLAGAENELLFEDKVETNLFNTTDKVLELLKAKYIGGTEISSKSPKWEYPEDALREAIINSLVNKDYTGSFIFMKIYDDRLYLWNPGTLPGKVHIEELTKAGLSCPYNPRIADIFFKAGDVRLAGSGIKDIGELCREAGLPAPIIKTEFVGFSLTLFKDIYSRESLQKYGLEERQIKALLFIKENKAITNSRYQEVFGMSRGTANNDLTLLMKRGLIERIGKKGRGISYILKRQ